MKKISLTSLLCLFILAGCHTSDGDIRADIASKAQQDLNFAGLSYTVQNGSVTFTGTCPSAKALAKVQQSVSNINVIKEARYQVKIAPVVLDALTPVKLELDSILAQHVQVKATLGPTGVVLKGNATSDERKKIFEALAKCQITAVKDSLTVLNVIE